jgi:hypothetical protein
MAALVKHRGVGGHFFFVAFLFFLILSRACEAFLIFEFRTG